jgi:hypothetical protein
MRGFKVGALLGGKIVPIEEIGKASLTISCSVEISGAANAALAEGLAEAIHTATVEYLFNHNPRFSVGEIAITRNVVGHD